MNNKLEKQLINKATKNNIPINVTLELTPLCNMNCEMCFIRLDKGELCAKGGLRTVDEWKCVIRQMQEAGTFFVLLTGGEPLLYEGFKDIYLTLHNMGMVVTLNTNGTLIDVEMADFFMAHPPRRINITLYGASNETYHKICHNPNGFTQVMSAIRLLKDRGIHVKLNGTIVPDNFCEIDRLYEIADGFDIPIEMETYIYPSHRERDRSFCETSRLSASDAACAYMLESRKRIDDFDKYVHDVLNDVDLFMNRPSYLKAEHMLCRGGKSSAWINWQGKMSPCVFMNHVSIDVFEHGFKESWEFVKQQACHISLPKECANCDYRPACVVCPAMCYCESGSFDRVPSYVCEYTQTIVKLMKDEYSR